MSSVGRAIVYSEGNGGSYIDNYYHLFIFKSTDCTVDTIFNVNIVLIIITQNRVLGKC